MNSEPPKPPLDYGSEEPPPRYPWLPFILLAGFIAWVYVMMIVNHGD